MAGSSGGVTGLDRRSNSRQRGLRRYKRLSEPLPEPGLLSRRLGLLSTESSQEARPANRLTNGRRCKAAHPHAMKGQA